MIYIGEVIDIEDPQGGEDLRLREGGRGAGRALAPPLPHRGA